jgi:two-component sensor histidine kinase
MTTWEPSAVAFGSIPRMRVGEQAATTLALVVHELATNSLKYGALSSPTGALDISRTAHDTEVVVVWTERGGPPVAAPSGEGGYGSKLLNRSMTLQLGGSISCDWSAEGVIVTLHMTKERLAR